MPEQPKSREFPYGLQVDSLVICRNEAHAQTIIRAFPMKAMYTYGIPALMGRRFKKIIVFKQYEERHSALEGKGFEQFCKEYLPTKLDIGGEIFYV